MDDVLIVAKSMSEVNKLKILLSTKFDMEDLGAAKKILRMEIHRNIVLWRLWLSRSDYVGKVLERFSIEDAEPIRTSLANHFRLSTIQCPKPDDNAQGMSKVPYASAKDS